VKCPECSAENRVNVLFCRECGAQLEHELSDVRATVDRERRQEQAKATAGTVRWFLAASIVLVIAGYAFRKAYKDLPGNDVVAFATAPTVDVPPAVTITENNPEFLEELDDKFGIDFPKPAKISAARPMLKNEEKEIKKLRKAAYQHDAVVVKFRATGRADARGLLLGDFYVRPSSSAKRKPIHISDVQRMIRRSDSRWGLEEARGLTLEARKSIAVEIPDPDGLTIQLIEITEEGKPKPPAEIRLSEVRRIERLRKGN
jgi:hypothetical protein